MVMKLQEVEPGALQAPVSALLNDCMDGITLVHSYIFFLRGLHHACHDIYLTYSHRPTITYQKWGMSTCGSGTITVTMQLSVSMLCWIFIWWLHWMLLDPDGGLYFSSFLMNKTFSSAAQNLLTYLSFVPISSLVTPYEFKICWIQNHRTVITSAQICSIIIDISLTDKRPKWIHMAKAYSTSGYLLNQPYCLG